MGRSGIKRERRSTEKVSTARRAVRLLLSELERKLQPSNISQKIPPHPFILPMPVQLRDVPLNTMRESEIQRAILAEFGSHPRLLLWRNNVGVARNLTDDSIRRFGLPGSADLIGCLAPEGRFIAIEVKSEKAKLMPNQVRFECAVRRMGGIYIVARSVEDVRKFLDL